MVSEVCITALRHIGVAVKQIRVGHKFGLGQQITL